MDVDTGGPYFEWIPWKVVISNAGFVENHDQANIFYTQI